MLAGGVLRQLWGLYCAMQNNVDQSSCLDSEARQKAGDKYVFGQIDGSMELGTKGRVVVRDIDSMAIEVGTRRFIGAAERIGISPFPSWLLCVGNSGFH